MTARQAYNVERFFGALGDNTRLRLPNLIGDQEICAGYFVEILGGPQPRISRHSAYRRSAELVEARRERKGMHDRIVMPPHVGAAQFLCPTLAWLKQEKPMQADRARLTKARCRCAPAKYALLEGASLTTSVVSSEVVCQ